MNRRRALIILGMTFVIIAALWTSFPKGQRVAELRYLGSSSSGHTFCLTNCSSKAAILTLCKIEIRDSRGWMVYTNFALAFQAWQTWLDHQEGGGLVPAHTSRNFRFAAPSSDLPWRVRIEVRQESGWLVKLRFWLSHYRNLPPGSLSIQGFRSYHVYADGKRYELISDEVRISVP